MRPKLEKINQGTVKSSFCAYRISVPYFEFFWHFHPEYELTLITSGKGKRLVGDGQTLFSTGDFVLLGPNLPHVWVSEPQDGPCEALVIQFPEIFIENMLRFPEFEGLDVFFKSAVRGISFTGVSNPISNDTYAYVSEKMHHLVEQLSLPAFFNFLVDIALLPHKHLATEHYSTPKSSKNYSRINQALHFIQSNYTRPITLSEIAHKIHLSESAFSKFFVRTLGKSFTAYLTELRVGHAVRLLMETDQSISRIAQLSGFENLSYFNRVFLEKKGCQPAKYRKMTHLSH